MKRKLVIYTFGILLLSLAGCIENVMPTFNGALVEFDAAIFNTPPAGFTYPVLTRVPGYGRAANATTTGAGPADPVINRTAGTVNFFVNLVGPQRNSDETIDISFVTDPITGETLATENTHFTLPASITLPANSSVAMVPVTILDPGATSGSVILVIQLDGNAAVEPSENYRRIALRIAQN